MHVLSERSQPLGEAATEPHHHYGHEVRRQSTRQGYLLSARPAVHARRAVVVVVVVVVAVVVAVVVVVLVVVGGDARLLVHFHPRGHSFRMNGRWFWGLRGRILGLVTGTLLETVLVVRDRILVRAVPGSASGTVPLRVL